MYCINCGNKLREGENYCPNCGIKTILDDNQNESTNYQRSQTRNENNTGTISLIFGILSLINLSKPLIAIILAAIGIVLGQKYKKETGSKSYGPLLGMISIIISLLIIFCIIMYGVFIVKEITDETSKNIEENYFHDDNDEENGLDEYESFDLKGYSWLGNDNSMLYLNNDNSYAWYQNDNVKDDNYHIGIYHFYTGQDAINYITNNLKEYNMTEEDQKDLIENSNYNLENYYFIELNCTESKINGVDQNLYTNKIHYYGFYDNKRQYLDLINMATKNQAGFILKNKLFHTDI